MQGGAEIKQTIPLLKLITIFQTKRPLQKGAIAIEINQGDKIENLFITMPPRKVKPTSLFTIKNLTKTPV